MIRVTHVLARLTAGGAETVVKRLAAPPFAACRHRVLVLAGGGALRPQYEAAGVDFEELGERFGPATVSRLIGAVRRERPDVLQGWMYYGNLAARLAQRALGAAPALAFNIRHSLTSLDYEPLRIRLSIRAGARAAGRAAAIVYCAHGTARQHEALGYPARKTVVIPNGFDSGLFRPDPEARQRLARRCGFDPATALVVGMLARAHPMKNHDGLIRALAGLHDRVPNLQLILAGAGVDAANPALAGLLAETGLAARTHLLGPVDDVAGVAPAFDLGVVPSRWGESFSNTLGEMMAAGVPCLSTDLGDCGLIVGDTGVVVAADDQGALVDGLVRLLALSADERRRRGAAARARIREHFDLDGVRRRYEELYRDLGAAAARP